MPANGFSLPSCGFSRLCSSLRAISSVLWSAASTTNLCAAKQTCASACEARACSAACGTYTIAFTPLQ